MKKFCRSLVFATPVIVCTAHAQAAEVGSSPEYPEGNTLGYATGTLPPPGLYSLLKSSYGQSNTTNGAGKFTGAHSDVWGNTAAFFYVAPIKILGADYAFFVRGLGYLDVSLTTPRAAGGATYDRIGRVDPEIAPISLSWPLGHAVFVAAEFGFYPPIGQYSSDAVVNVGQNHWTIEPNASISYLPKGYQFTVHATFDRNFKNTTTRYTNGTTMDLDFTTLKSFGRWSVGPVGYYYKQITPDEGPVHLNGGSPIAFAVGMDVAYKGTGYRINAYYTHDVIARNVADTGKAVASIVFPF